MVRQLNGSVRTVDHTGNLLRANLEAIYTASLVSKSNAVVVSPPGHGKTKMSYHMARGVVNGHTGMKMVFLPLSPSTPPERITGPVDILALKQGQLRYNLEDTPYDPQAQIVILDEFGRANEIVFDLLIHATNDVTRVDSPVFWGTSNFVPKSSRTEALIDRFPLWYHFISQGVDVHSVVNSEDMSTWKFELPTLKDALDIRQAPFPQKSKDAVEMAINYLIEAIGNEKGFVINERRVEAWREILFRCSIWVTGENSFRQVPEDAMRFLRFAFPTRDDKEFRKWESIASSVVDVIGTAIEQYMVVAQEKFRSVIDSSNGNDKASHMSELGQVMAECEEELTRLGGNDPRVKEALNTFNKWFRQAASGKKVSS